MVSIKEHEQEEPSVMKISTVGLDLAKNVFQDHGIDEAGEVVMRKTAHSDAKRPLIPI